MRLSYNRHVFKLDHLRATEHMLATTQWASLPESLIKFFEEI
jgi:hypothetical protein